MKIQLTSLDDLTIWIDPERVETIIHVDKIAALDLYRINDLMSVYLLVMFSGKEIWIDDEAFNDHRHNLI